MKNLFCTVYDIRRSILFYLTYFCMVGGIVSMMTYDGNEVFACPGFYMMLIGMFGFWITLFFLKFGDYFGDSAFLTRKEALWLGLVSTGLLLVLQLYIRHAYDHYGFFSMFSLLPDYENLKTYQGHLITFKNILVGLLGFSFFSLQMEGGDDVGYNYVEVTTYFSDSGMEIDRKVSDSQRAVGGYILLGLATTILPFCVALTPVMILVFSYFALRLQKHKSQKVLKRKRIAAWVVTVILSLVSVLMIIIPIPTKERAVLKYKWEIEDGELFCRVVSVLNESTATYIKIPKRHLFMEISFAKGVFDDCKNIEKAKIPLGKLRQFPSAKELIITHEGSTWNMDDINSSLKMSAKKITFAYDIEKLECSFLGFDALREIELPDSLRTLGDYDFTYISGTTYGSGEYVGSEENPYLLLVSVDIDATSLTLHPDTRFITSGVAVNRKQLKTVDLTPATKLVSIGQDAFRQCEALESVAFPDAAFFIRSYAFAYCRALESITIPDSVYSIADHAFVGCSSLVSATLPEGTSSVADNLFDECTNLKTVNLSSKTSFIGKNAFAGCANLEKIYVPSTLSKIYSDAWKDCNAKIYYHGDMEKWSKVLVIGQGHYIKPPLFYSETPAEGCWHYGAEGEILEW